MSGGTVREGDGNIQWRAETYYGLVSEQCLTESD
jgi:hypothetical protein